MQIRTAKRRKARRLQYTIRGIPPEIDRALREQALQNGRSLNDVVVEALRRGAGVDLPKQPNNDLLRFAGTWVEDPAFDEAMKDFERLDEDLWR
jgi:hypothetical protein